MCHAQAVPLRGGTRNGGQADQDPGQAPHDLKFCPPTLIAGGMSGSAYACWSDALGTCRTVVHLGILNKPVGTVVSTQGAILVHWIVRFVFEKGQQGDSKDDACACV